MRLWSAITCELNLDMCHFDVEQVFVHSKLEEDVFLRLPKGCRSLSGKIVRLNKSLYGTRSTIEGGRGGNTFVPVLGGDGTKTSSTGDIFDELPGEMS